MKNLTLLLVLCVHISVFAQQLPEASNFSATNFMLNPAMTASMNHWEVGAVHRQQWMGFEDAPRTTGVGVQYPFVDQNMSIGAYIQHDQIHPMRSNAISFTYAYKLQFWGEHQLSIGALASISEYHIDSDGIIVDDSSDGLIPMDAMSQMKPNAGLGLYYQSYTGGDFEQTYYFAGIGSNQLLGSSLDFEASDQPSNFKRTLHGNALLGMRIINDRLALEPSVWIDYAKNSPLNSNFRFNIELHQTFWTGVSFATSGMAAFQAGLILKNGILKDGTLRIGSMATYNVGTLGRYQGVGYEFYIAYRFEND